MEKKKKIIFDLQNNSVQFVFDKTKMQDLNTESSIALFHYLLENINVKDLDNVKKIEIDLLNNMLIANNNGEELYYFDDFNEKYMEFEELSEEGGLVYPSFNEDTLKTLLNYPAKSSEDVLSRFPNELNTFIKLLEIIDDLLDSMDMQFLILQGIDENDKNQDNLYIETYKSLLSQYEQLENKSFEYEKLTTLGIIYQYEEFIQSLKALYDIYLKLKKIFEDLSVYIEKTMSKVNAQDI